LPGIGVPTSVAEVAAFLATVSPTWHKFDVVNDIIGGNVTTIREVATAFVEFQALSGVAYTEVRYDPVRLAHSSYANTTISEDAVVEAVQEGLAKGAREYGVAVYQLLCAMRGKSSERCDQTVELAARMRSRGGMGSVVGVDLAGDESDYPNGPYVPCLRRAKLVHGLNTTVHAGEFMDTPAEEVRVAVLEMGADRIGHGYAAARNPAVMLLLREQGVHLETCPSSAKDHGLLMTIGAFRQAGLNFGLNTDDRASFFDNASLPEDEALVRRSLGFTDDDLAAALAATWGAAFAQTASGFPVDAFLV